MGWLSRKRAPVRPAIWYDRRYRLPLPGIEARFPIEPRRADFVATYLVERGPYRAEDLQRPERATYADLARVHGHELLESLGRPDRLAGIFGADEDAVRVDDTLVAIRLAVGGTIAAAREALRTGAATLNLLGGFHHAAPDLPGPLCPVNDVAVAAAAVRADGFRGGIAVIDLDAHPPDGLAACFAAQSRVWIGSLSGASWGALPGVDETLISPGAGDAHYLADLERLLARVPRASLAFVIAGGDVLAGDPVGNLGLTLEGARARDRAVAEHLGGVPSVWLPGGGYHRDAWKVLAGTALVLAGRGGEPIDPAYEPVAAHFAAVARGLDLGDLGHAGDITEADIVADLRSAPPRTPRLLGYYTADGVELALDRYGVLPYLRTLGYRDFRVELLDDEDGRDRARLWARCRGADAERILVECILERRILDERAVLYVHWLSMRDAARCDRAGLLPGQERPGLGLAREVGELFVRMAERLGLEGVAFAPSWYHLAFFARERCRFVDPERQGRFEALVRDLRKLPLAAATAAVSAGRVLLDGAPYRWEPDDMALWLDGREPDPARVKAARESAHFRLPPEPARAASVHR
jgi:acetoin utilization deacetylase AcuC-like enzyme